MSRPATSLRSAINDHCRECSYDPKVSGTWREQIAACPSVNCHLHDVRPVPRTCQIGGKIDASACHAIADELNERDARRFNR